MPRHSIHLTTIVLASALAIPAPSHAAVHVVSNCKDSGNGSLRAAIASAASGDVVDLSRLLCTRITLTGGELIVPQASLTLRGRNRAAMTIDGNLNGRVLRHDGTGWLHIENLTIARGHLIGPSRAEGGCVRSAGSVELDCVRVNGCIAEPVGGAPGEGISAGGGLSAVGDIVVSNSAVHDNQARDRGLGGGLRTESGHVKLLHSQVVRNRGLRGPSRAPSRGCAAPDRACREPTRGCAGPARGCPPGRARLRGRRSRVAAHRCEGGGAPTDR